MEILTQYQYRGVDNTCTIKFNDMEEMIILHRALRALKFISGDKNGVTLDKMLSQVDKWHRLYNPKRYQPVLTFS